jgi:glyoxalase family protein
MRLQGLHHITMITADARENVTFYADILGLRLVKQTVNFDQPDAYHLYFGDERGSPGSILTWFEFPGAAAGRPGAGMIHRIDLGVGSGAALDFWEERLRSRGYLPVRERDGVRFDDYNGLALMLVVADRGDPPLRAERLEIPPEHAILGVDAARAYSSPGVLGGDHGLLSDTLGFTALGDGAYRLDGEQRSFGWVYDPAPAAAGIPGAGSVHHIAWASRDEDHLAWRARVRDAGLHVTDVLDRDYFRSIYFREPRHILFEIATLSPGFAVDEDPEHLGEQLRLPLQHERLRAQLEKILTPIENPRAPEMQSSD